MNYFIFVCIKLEPEIVLVLKLPEESIIKTSQCLTVNFFYSNPTQIIKLILPKIVNKQKMSNNNYTF